MRDVCRDADTQASAAAAAPARERRRRHFAAITAFRCRHAAAMPLPPLRLRQRLPPPLPRPPFHARYLRCFFAAAVTATDAVFITPHAVILMLMFSGFFDGAAADTPLAPLRRMPPIFFCCRAAMLRDIFIID